MAASCLNHTLITRAVGGTSVNVTELIAALTPLCTKPPQPVSMLANHFGTVVAGYLCGFLPWGFLALVDFISAKWKTVRDTRRAGYFHIIASLLPMMFVIAYAVLQGMSGDYKEMMTAVIAVLITLYHMARTVWGLAQLRVYKRWCNGILECTRKCSPRSYDDEVYGNPEDDKDKNVVDLDTALMVNENIVDNEFSGHDVTITFNWKEAFKFNWKEAVKLNWKKALKLNWKEAKMQASDVYVCTVRWGAAFQCSLGHLWRSNSNKSLPSHLVRSLAYGLFSINGTTSTSSIISFWAQASQWHEKGTGAFGDGIKKHLVSGEDPFDLYKFEFDNIVSSYPSSSGVLGEAEAEVIKTNRADARVDLVQVILAAKNSSHDILSTLQSQHSQLLDSYGTVRRLEDAWNLLQNQLGIEKEVAYKDVHWFYKLIMVPMFSAKSNPFVLQASAFQDILIFTFIGHVIWDSEEQRNEQLVYGDELKSCKRIFQQIGYRESSYALGASLDAVRSLLAQWVLCTESGYSPNSWNPEIPCQTISFDINTDVYSLNRLDGYDIVYLSQHALFQEATKQDAMTAQPGAASVIMLFLLSYPGFKCTSGIEYKDAYKVEYMDTEFYDLIPHEVENWQKIVITIEPVLAPQKLSISVNIFKNSNASVNLVCATPGMRFEWQNWINVAMAILKTHNEIVKEGRGNESAKKFVGPLDLIKSADLSRQMLKISAPHENLTDLHGTLNVWTGWPLFDVRFCQFEMNQWLELSESLSEDKPSAYSEYASRMDAAKDNLTEIASWNRW